MAPNTPRPVLKLDIPMPELTQLPLQIGPRLKVLLFGSGAREYSLAWKLSHRLLVERIYVVPCNAGTAAMGKAINITHISEAQTFMMMLHRECDLVRLMLACCMGELRTTPKFYEFANYVQARAVVIAAKKHLDGAEHERGLSLAGWPANAHLFHSAKKLSPHGPAVSNG